MTVANLSTVWAVLHAAQHYADYVSTIGSCMPSRRLRRLDAHLVLYCCQIIDCFSAYGYNIPSRHWYHSIAKGLSHALEANEADRSALVIAATIYIPECNCHGKN